jgi:predicted anti-sigma-YlaC factor YlaD
MKDCDKYQEMISAMIDGALSETQEQQLKEHIEQCMQCRAMYEAFAALADGIETVPAPPARLHEGIMSAVANAGRNKKKEGTIIHLRRYVTAAACLVIIVGAVLAVKSGAVSQKNYSKSSDTAPAMAESAARDTATLYAEEGTTEAAPAGMALPDSCEAENYILEDSIWPEPEEEPAESTEWEYTQESVELDVKESFVSVERDGSISTGALDGTDTLLWLRDVIERRSECFSAATMEISCVDTDAYTVYLFYDGGQLMGRLNPDDEGMALDTLEDFIRLVNK